MRTDHLTAAEVAAALDEPGVDAEARAHLEQCEQCRRERDRVAGVLEALGALPDLEAPDHWSVIEAELRRSQRRVARTDLTLRRAAVFVLLFGAGAVAGSLLDVAGTRDPGPSVKSFSTDALEQLDALRTDLTLVLPAGDRRVTERRARLRAMVDATLAALEHAPANAPLNRYLFEAAPALQLFPDTVALPPAEADREAYRSTRRDVEELLLAHLEQDRTTGKLLANERASAAESFYYRHDFALGAQLAPLSGDLAVAVPGAATGLLVLRLLPGTPAERAGMQAGDVLIGGDNETVRTIDELRAVFQKKDAPADVQLSFSRRTGIRSGSIPIR
jgi:hypothetical protein